MIRPSLRRTLHALVIASAFLSVPLSDASAAPIKGKIGLGVDTGELLNSSAEGTLIVGRSERTAWLWAINANGSTNDGGYVYDYAYPDTLIERDRGATQFSLAMGPGIRRFLREGEHISPYFDFVAQVLYARAWGHDGDVTSSYGRSDTAIGGQVGLAIGAEYFFERWPISLAAHTGLLNLRYQHLTTKQSRGPDHLEASSDEFSASEGLGPRVQVRVYF